MISLRDALEGRRPLLRLPTDPMRHAHAELPTRVGRRVDPVQVGFRARSVLPFIFVYRHRLSVLFFTLVRALVARMLLPPGLARFYC